MVNKHDKNIKEQGIFDDRFPLMVKSCPYHLYLGIMLSKEVVLSSHVEKHM